MKGFLCWQTCGRNATALRPCVQFGRWRRVRLRLQAGLLYSFTCSCRYDCIGCNSFKLYRSWNVCTPKLPKKDLTNAVASALRLASRSRRPSMLLPPEGAVLVCRQSELKDASSSPLKTKCTSCRNHHVKSDLHRHRDISSLSQHCTVVSTWLASQGCCLNPARSLPKSSQVKR